MCATLKSTKDDQTKKPHIPVGLFCDPARTKLEPFIGGFKTIVLNRKLNLAKRLIPLYLDLKQQR